MATRAQIKQKTMRDLACDPKVDQVEDYGMDEGRFFVHLKKEWSWDDNDGIHQSRSFGTKKEAETALKKETALVSEMLKRFEEEN